MVLRSVVGACAGALAGGGFVLTIEGFNQYCRSWPGNAGCGDAGVFLVLPMIAFWMLVAGVLIYAGFRLARAERGWWTAAAGSALWIVLVVVVMWFRISYVDLGPGDRQLFFVAAAVVTAGVSYLLAALSVGRARTC
ncbi:hypothetical protein [Lentzea sp. NPDC051838]|uniref:hypothetical protein n=1 Tax=Lentzea sp. NPDC051838 TaxID=3154849 RepID=UPI003412460C